MSTGLFTLVCLAAMLLAIATFFAINVLISVWLKRSERKARLIRNHDINRFNMGAFKGTKERQ